MSNRHQQRYYHRRQTGNRQPADWWERRRQGFGMNLYRNTRDQKIAGVCAGVADHFNVDHWVIRLAAVGGFFFFNMLMIWAYIGAWICLAPRPKSGTVEQRYRYDETSHQDRPVNMFRYQTSPSDRLRTAKSRMDDVLDRVGKMERYVTSRRYELDKEFSKIE
jgi:phage shock protein C